MSGWESRTLAGLSYSRRANQQLAFICFAGRAKLSISSPEGKTLIVRIARAGDLLGVNSVLKGVPCEATVETLERCSIHFVSRADFISQLHKNKGAWAEVSQALGNELSELLERVRLLLLSRNTRDKLVRLLLEWFDDFGEPTPNGIRIDTD